MNENKEVELTVGACPAIGYQTASVCVPVSVKPFAKTGISKTRCCGNPVIQPGKKTCRGTKDGECIFTITQEICVEVPLEFGANTRVGDIYVDCLRASTEDSTNDECSQKETIVAIEITE